MAAKRILILGGNRYNRDCIRDAREAGFFVFVADRNPESPGFDLADVPLRVDIVDVEALNAAIDEQGGMDGVVSMAEVGVRSAAELCERRGLATIGVEAARRATSKIAMRECWSSIGPFSIPFGVASSAEELGAAAARLGAFPLIVKPDRSLGGSRGVSRIESIAEVEEAFRFAISAGLPGSRVLVEPCLIGTEHSCEVLIDGDRTSVLCIGQKIKSPAPYRVDFSVTYPSELDAGAEGEIERMCQSAVRALGLRTGVAHIEFVQTAKGPVLMELGARCGGGHTPVLAKHASGVDEFIEVCRMACGIPVERFRPIHRRSAEYRFLVFPPGRVTRFLIPEALKQTPGVYDADVTATVPCMIGPLRTTSDRAGFAILLGDEGKKIGPLPDWVCGQVEAVYDDGSRRTALTALQIQASQAAVSKDG